MSVRDFDDPDAFDGIVEEITDMPNPPPTTEQIENLLRLAEDDIEKHSRFGREYVSVQRDFLAAICRELLSRRAEQDVR